MRAGAARRAGAAARGPARGPAARPTAGRAGRRGAGPSATRGARAAGRPGRARRARAGARRRPAARSAASESSRVPTTSVVRRLASTSSATWRSATSRSAARFSMRKKPLSAASMRSGWVDLARPAAASSSASGVRSMSTTSSARPSTESGIVSRTRTPRQLGHLVVERLEVLDVDRGEHVDPGVEHVLDVLVALVVLERPARWCARARRSGTAPARARRIAGQVHLLEVGAAVGHAPPRHDLAAPRPARSCPRARASRAARSTTSRPASCSAWPSCSMRYVLPTPAAMPRKIV